MTETTQKPPVVVPRWLVRTIWVAHRTAYPLTRGRFGLRPATETQWGMLRLKTVGRRSGRERVAIVGFIVDGGSLVTPAMNGWADPEPAWWLNLQARPEATVELPDGSVREVTARAATGEERCPPVADVPRSRELGIHGRERRPAIPRDRDRRPGAAGRASASRHPS